MNKVKYDTKITSISDLFKANDYLLVEMCIETIELINPNNGVELLEGPVVLDKCRAFSVQHAYELFRNSAKKNFDGYKVFVSSLEKLEQYEGGDYKYGFVATATNTKTGNVSSHQFFIVKDSPYIREQVKMLESVDI